MLHGWLNRSFTNILQLNQTWEKIKERPYLAKLKESAENTLNSNKQENETAKKREG